MASINLITAAALVDELERNHGDRALDGLHVQVSGPRMMEIIRTLRTFVERRSFDNSQVSA